MGAALPCSPERLPGTDPIPTGVTNFDSKGVAFRGVIIFFTPGAPTTSLWRLSVFSEANYALHAAGNVPAGVVTAMVPVLICTVLVPGPTGGLPAVPRSRIESIDTVPTATIKETGKDSVVPSVDLLPKGSCFADARTEVIPVVPFVATTTGTRAGLMWGSTDALTLIVISVVSLGLDFTI